MTFMGESAISKQVLFICRFAPDFYSIDNDNLCCIVYRIENAIITYSDPVAFFVCKFFTAARPRILGNGENGLIEGSPEVMGDFSSVFFGFTLNDEFITHGLSHSLRNFS